jgi:hypothetical protein
MAYFDIPTQLPTSALHYTDHSSPPVTSAIPIRALKHFAKLLPGRKLHDAALDTINLAGDLVTGNRALRDEQAYQRWRSQRVEELLQAMEQVCTHHTGVGNIRQALLTVHIGYLSRRLREMHHRTGQTAGSRPLETGLRVC